MVNLNNFVNKINEAGKVSQKTAPVADASELQGNKGPVMGMDGKPAPASEVNKLLKGKNAIENDMNGKVAVEPPQGADADGKQYTLLDPNHMTKNQRRLASRMSRGENFMAEGLAGWGKTAEITAMAHKFGRTVLTVYLDKAEARDLEGIPAPKQDKKGNLTQDNLMPVWVQYLADRPNEKFLLFFDEMNQADGAVQNALMPICLKHVICGHQFHNFIVGAAGNLKGENDYLTPLSAPLKARLMPFVWETGTQDAWQSHFDWAHKQYDSTLTKEFIDLVSNNWQYWKSPRDITILIYERAKKAIEGIKLFDTRDDIQEELLEHAVNPDQNKKDTAFISDFEEFVDYFYKFLVNPKKAMGLEKEEDSYMDDERNEDFETNITIIKDALMAGYIEDNGYTDPETGEEVEGTHKKYVVTADTVGNLLDPQTTGINGEVIAQIIKDMKKNKQAIKFPTMADYEEWTKTSNETYEIASDDEEEALGYMMLNSKKSRNNPRPARHEQSSSLRDYVNK